MIMVKSDSKKKSGVVDAKKVSGDTKINRLMVAFILGVVAVTCMLLVKKNIANEAFFITYILPVLLVVSVLSFAASIYLFVRRRGSDESARIFTGANVLGAALVFMPAVLYYRLTFEATMVIGWFIVAVVLYFVYNIFTYDFFVYSLLSAAGVMLLRGTRIDYMTSFSSVISLIFAILALLFAVVGIVIAVMANSNNGRLKLGSRSIKLYGAKGGHIYPLLITAVLIIAGGILSILAPAFVIYAVAALIAAYLAIAVVYVIKMM